MTNRRVVITHGWADDPTKGWIAWMVDQLKQLGIEAQAPQFPNPKKPDIKAWLQTFEAAIGQPDDQLVLVGHSLGCMLIIRYLSNLDPSVRIAGIVLVAGMADIPQWRHPALFDPPLDFDKVRAIAQQRICIYSDDDDKVLPERTQELARKLEAELIADHGKGHFAGFHGCTELPSALAAVRECFK
jgi:uncharacterized protein